MAFKIRLLLRRAAPERAQQAAEFFVLVSRRVGVAVAPQAVQQVLRRLQVARPQGVTGPAQAFEQAPKVVRQAGGGGQGHALVLTLCITAIKLGSAAFQAAPGRVACSRSCRLEAGDPRAGWKPALLARRRSRAVAP
jgi:hypothetical protein